MKLCDRIIPVPQKLEILSEKEFSLGKNGFVIRADLPETELTASALARLEKGLEERFGTKQAKKGFVFHLSMGKAPETIPNPEQGYSLTVTKKGAELVGFGQAGLFYGVTTILQILGAETLPSFTVLDYPILAKRGHYIESRYGTDLMELEDWKQVVDDLVAQKQNHLTISLYGCWNIQFDNRISEFLYMQLDGFENLKTPVFKKYYSPEKGAWINEECWPPMAEKDLFGEIRKYGKSLGVDVIPMFNSLGHNTLIPRLYPEISAIAEDGSYSQLGFCVSNPKTYEFLFRIYDQILDRYGKDAPIESFDIGLDEVAPGRSYIASDVGNWHSPICRCPECSKMTSHEQLYTHAVKIAKYLKSRGVKTVYMYNDMICEHRLGRNNNAPVDFTYRFRNLLLKENLLDTICVDWWGYGNIPEIWHFYSLHSISGIRRTAKPWNGYQHWSYLVHSGPNVYHMAKMAVRDEAEGFRSYSAWENSFHRNNQMQADWAWNFHGTGDLQAEKDRYVRRYFEGAEGEASRAFDLMEDITREADTENPNNTLTNRKDLLSSTLSFYAYPYYRHGYDYPRNYPGEMVPALREKPFKVEDMKEMIAQAEEAVSLWKKVSEKCKNEFDRTLALRYAYDSGTYEMLCRDGVALMEMDALAQTYAETKDEGLVDQILAIAKDQHKRRLDHLALLEKTKEHYIIPIQARVASAPMQYFADVAAYLEKTPKDELKLDFTDMRHACSEEFFNLR